VSHSCKYSVEYRKKAYFSPTGGSVDTQERLGRYYPTRGMFGLQPMEGRLRRLLIDDRCVEVDLVNSLPSLLLNLCDAYFPQPSNRLHLDADSTDWPLPELVVSLYHLRQYVTHREDLVTNLQVELGDHATLEMVKGLLLRICFGGTFAGFCRDNPRWANAPIPGCLEGLQKCISQIRNAAPVHFASLEYSKFTSAKLSGPNPSRSTFALFLQDMESRVISCTLHYLREVCGLSVRALIHDGILIEKDSAWSSLTRQGDVDFLYNMENFVSERVGHCIFPKFKVKAVAPTVEDLEWFRNVTTQPPPQAPLESAHPCVDCPPSLQDLSFGWDEDENGMYDLLNSPTFSLGPEDSLTNLEIPEDEHLQEATSTPCPRVVPPVTGNCLF